jgi:hypothetical protein
VPCEGGYAPLTLGTLLREFTFGHARQLESVLGQHLVALAGRTELWGGIEQLAFIDIDSLLRPVYGHAKQGASYGFSKIAGKQVLRKGLSPFADLIDGPLAHMPSGRFGANSAWVLCTGIAHNLLHAARTLAGHRHDVAPGATLRRRIITVSARLARPGRKPVLHLPRRWPWISAWRRLWQQVIGHSPPATT